jgi:hypothetical protein
MYYEKYLKYKTKYLNLKNIKMIGGTLSELDSLDVSTKTIILVCDYHEKKINSIEYLDIIKKQKQIIDLVLSKFGQDKTYFYSETPKDFKDLVLKSDNFSTSAIAQYAITKLPVKFSSITHCDRRNGNQCNYEYSNDILSIFDENSNINCIIVIIGLLHIPYLKILINDQLPDIKIIIVNTLSNNQLNPLIQTMAIKYPPVIKLLEIESPYELPIESPSKLPIESPSKLPIESPYKLPIENFIVEVLYNQFNEKIYKCPDCQAITGNSAPKNPTNTSLFTHSYLCPNKDKIPIEKL